MPSVIEALCIGGPKDREWQAETGPQWPIAVIKHLSALDDLDPLTPVPYEIETYRYREFATGQIPAPLQKQWWDYRDGKTRIGYSWPLWVHESVDLEEFGAQANLILAICKLVNPGA